MITIKHEPQERELVPAGTHEARCYSMIHYGTIPVDYKGETKWQNKVRIIFELPNEQRVFNEDKGLQPFSIGKEYTLSLYEQSTLRKDLENWRGHKFSDDELNGFDLSRLLGVACMVTVVHAVSASGNKYAKIGNITGLPKGWEVKPLCNPIFEFTVTDFAQDRFDQLPAYYQDKIKSSREYQAITFPNADFHNDADSAPDGVPF